jgi:hypothetical protein
LVILLEFSAVVFRQLFAVHISGLLCLRVNRAASFHPSVKQIRLKVSRAGEENFP